MHTSKEMKDTSGTKKNAGKKKTEKTCCVDVVDVLWRSNFSEIFWVTQTGPRGAQITLAFVNRHEFPDICWFRWVVGVENPLPLSLPLSSLSHRDYPAHLLSVLAFVREFPQRGVKTPRDRSEKKTVQIASRNRLSPWSRFPDFFFNHERLDF